MIAQQKDVRVLSQRLIKCRGCHEFNKAPKIGRGLTKCNCIAADAALPSAERSSIRGDLLRIPFLYSLVPLCWNLILMCCRVKACLHVDLAGLSLPVACRRRR